MTLAWNRLAAEPVSRSDLCDRVMEARPRYGRAEAMRDIALAQREGRLRVVASVDDLLLQAHTPTPHDKFASPEHAQAMSLLNKHSFFLTGSAGTGKSHLLDEMYRTAVRVHSGGAGDQAGKLHVYSTALTGIAASRNLDGTTLHSFAGIQTGSEPDFDELVRVVQANKLAMRRWRNCEVLFVDEVSMLDCALLERLERLARVLRNSTRVFGGILVGFVGDFFQTPPTASKGGGYCFESPVWHKIVQHRCVELKQVFRTKDQRLVRFLGDFRVGKVDEHIMQELCSRPRNNTSSDGGVLPTCLLAKNADVDRVNAERLAQLIKSASSPTELVEQHAYVSMDWRADGHVAVEQDNRGSTPVTLAVGAQVVLTKNMPELGLVNGSRGVVVGFAQSAVGMPADEGEGEEEEEEEEEDAGRYLSSEAFARRNPEELLPLVKFLARNSPVLIERYEFASSSEDEDHAKKKKTSSRYAVPLRLAWALTMHKSQGQTIDLVHVNLSGVFEYGQAFVALSRATSMDGLSVEGYPPRSGSLKLCHPKVVRFYAEMKQLQPVQEEEEEASTAATAAVSQDNEEDVAWISTSNKKKRR